MSLIRLHVDEDAQSSGLVRALDARGVEVVSATSAQLLREPDSRQLVFAAEHGLVLYTFNVGHFLRLHTEFVHAGQEHRGIIFGIQQRYSIGEPLRRILRIREALTAEQMRNRAEFLSNWG